MTFLKLVADMLLRQLTPILNENPIFCMNNAPFATGIKHPANDVSGCQ